MSVEQSTASAPAAPPGDNPIATPEGKHRRSPRESVPRIKTLESKEPDGTPIEWISANKAAKNLLGINTKAVYAWIERGFGPPVYLFYGQWRYKKHEIEAWIETRRKIMSEPLFRVLSVVEASHRIGVHENTLWRWIERGKGPPSFIFNGRYVFRETDVTKWVEENKVNTEDKAETTTE